MSRVFRSRSPCQGRRPPRKKSLPVSNTHAFPFPWMPHGHSNGGYYKSACCLPIPFGCDQVGRPDCKHQWSQLYRTVHRVALEGYRCAPLSKATHRPPFSLHILHWPHLEGFCAGLANMTVVFGKVVSAAANTRSLGFLLRLDLYHLYHLNPIHSERLGKVTPFPSFLE